MSWVQKIGYNELNFEFARSRGPGGQNVNRTNSAAILRWNPSESQSFSSEQKERLLNFLKNKLTVEGELIVRSEEFRDQTENKRRCFEKLDELISRAFFIPKKRRATKPTRSSKEKRITAKKNHGYIKSLRNKKNLE